MKQFIKHTVNLVAVVILRPLSLMAAGRTMPEQVKGNDS
jgi:hypothetical protein